MVKMIDNYTLLETLGEGNYGKVYRAKNIRNNQDYAIKIIPTEKLHENAKLEECTMNEIQTLTTIGKTENIIMYYEMLKTKNNYYFVYEFCDGGTLQEVLRKDHHLSEERALQIFKQLLEAFKVLNRLSIMHRDLKPQNIFFKSGHVKLGDFGFCKGLRPEENMTRTMLGSPIYMAPEVLKGEPYSTKADIWSLGVILYEMLYGVCPFQSSSIAMLIDTINFSKQINLPSNIEVSQKTQKLLKRLLTKDHFRRIGWIELFNWFTAEVNKSLEQKQNVVDSFAESAVCCNPGSPHSKNMTVDRNSKQTQQLRFKQRSASHDVKTQKNRFQVGVLENVTPVTFQQRTTPFTPKINAEKYTGFDEEDMSNSVNQTAKYTPEYKSYSAIKVTGECPSTPYNHGSHSNQRKPVSLPKRQLNSTSINQQGGSMKYHSSIRASEKGSSTLQKRFYSQNYQNIFATPINDKSGAGRQGTAVKESQNQSVLSALSNNQCPNSEETDQNQSATESGNLTCEVSEVPESQKKQGESFNRTSTQKHRASLVDRSSSAKAQRRKREALLGAHEECLRMIQLTYKELETHRSNYLLPAYLTICKILLRLKEITSQVHTNEIDLLDIASLINYEIIQVDRMVIDLKDQLKSQKTLDQSLYEEIVGKCSNLSRSSINQCVQIIRGQYQPILRQQVVEFLKSEALQDSQSDHLHKQEPTDNDEEEFYRQNSNNSNSNNVFAKNISIVAMLPQDRQQSILRDERSDLKGSNADSIVGTNSINERRSLHNTKDDETCSSSKNSYLKYNKGQYHTTNGFSEYYKNFVADPNNRSFNQRSVSKELT